MIELIVGGTMSFGPFEDCGGRNVIAQTDWGASVTLVSSDEKLKFGYSQEREGLFDLYGYYVANKKEGVWLSCAATGDSVETLRTRYNSGVEIGPREYLKEKTIYKVELLLAGEVVARIVMGQPAGTTYASEIDRNREHGVTVLRSAAGALQLTTTTAGTANGLQVKEFGKVGAEIGILENDKLIKSLSENAFSDLLSDLGNAGTIGFQASVEPYFSGVYKAPYGGTFQSRMTPPLLDWILDLKGKVLWDTRSDPPPFDLRPTIGELNWSGGLSAVPQLAPPWKACMPEAEIRSDPDNLFFVPATIQALGLYTPEGLENFQKEVENGLTVKSLQILRWSHPFALDRTDNDVLDRASMDFPFLREAIKRTWSSLSCRRALLYWGYFRPINPQLRQTRGAPPELINALRSGEPSSEEKALVEILRYKKRGKPTIQQVFAWLNECVGEGGTLCGYKMKDSFDEHAWYQAQLLGTPVEPLLGIQHHLDPTSVGMASEFLANLWIDEFHRKFESMLTKPAEDRVAFVQKMRGSVIEASTWASRMQVLLLWPWTTEKYREPLDYEPSLRSRLEHSKRPPSGFSDKEQEAARQWYDREKDIVETASVKVQSDFAAAGFATDMFLDYLDALVETADNEGGVSTPDKSTVQERILTSGLPDETIQIHDQYLPSPLNVNTLDALFSYTSDDFFKVTFTVPAGSDVSTQIAGAPISVVLLPANGLDSHLMVCGGDGDSRCDEPSVSQRQLLLARLVFSGAIETRTRQPDGSVGLSVVVNCGDRCRTLPRGKGDTMFKARPTGYDELLQFLNSGRPKWSGDKFNLSDNLLKSAGPWIAVPILVGGFLHAQD